ncbi:glycine betaine ABC transporter substrate-binding protein [Evtepia gabavorous]|uniref:glycine betaine ABC transporter substrate-binding protein n=1 Tax=Evtepia gabavorous TaxID=2211183 RepID=UPI003A8DA22A
MKLWKKCLATGMAAAMVLALAACGGEPSNQEDGQDQGGATADKTITVGTSNFTEVIILGEIYTQLIEAKTDYNVDQKFSLAGAAVCFDALENGEIDMFVEYTGTALMNLLAQPMASDKDEVWNTVSELMEKDHGIATSNPLGFNNTYVMSVKPETAEQYNLKTLSDLIEKSPELNLGCTVEFIQREDCLPLLESKYDASFKDVSGLDASLRYDAIEAGEVDVVDAFATDALLSKLGLTMLEDDLNFFPPYYAVNFVDKELLDSDPQLAETLALLDGTIDEEKMAAMNAQVDVDGMDAKDVAHDFLVEQGLIEG